MGLTNTCLVPTCWGDEQLWCGDPRGELAISWAKQVSRSESLLLPVEILYRRSLKEKSNKIKLCYSMKLMKK